MSTFRISRQRPPAVADTSRRVTEHKKAPVSKAEPAKAQPVDGGNENFVSAIASFRQPPKLNIPADFLIPKTSVTELFATEMESLSKKDVSEVAGVLADVFLTHAQRAQKEDDAQLIDAFEQIGELMRGYEHLRMMKTGDLG